MAKEYGQRPSTLLGLRPESWEAYQLDSAALTLANRIDAAAQKEAGRAARRRHDDGGASITRAIMRILDPDHGKAPARGDIGPVRRVVYDLRPDGEVTWRYEDEPAPAGSTPLSAAA